jgi:hypothetical protein
MSFFRPRAIASQPVPPPRQRAKPANARDAIPEELKERRALVREIPVPQVSEGNSEQEWSDFDACCDDGEPAPH